MVENYFKDRKEVEQFFKGEFFKFKFMSDNMMCFETLSPKSMADDYYTFQVSFYFELGECFFEYSSFDEWLDKFQLAQVESISNETHERCEMYFRQYQDNNI